MGPGAISACSFTCILPAHLAMCSNLSLQPAGEAAPAPAEQLVVHASYYCPDQQRLEAAQLLLGPHVRWLSSQAHKPHRWCQQLVHRPGTPE